MRWLVPTFILVVPPSLVLGAEPLRLNLRSKDRVTTATWAPAKTAIIVCDMWDQHWCKSAARRVAEMAGPLNETLNVARSRGVFIIHAPSTVTAFYKDTPQRHLAQQAPYSATPIPLVTSPRWGTAWYWPDAKREGVLPIDDSDMGCDCQEKCTIRHVAGTDLMIGHVENYWCPTFTSSDITGRPAFRFRNQ